MHPIDSYLLLALLDGLVWWDQHVPVTAYFVAVVFYGWWKIHILFGDDSARSSPAAEK